MLEPLYTVLINLDDAIYERIIALENALREKSAPHLLLPKDLDRLGVELFYYRSVYELGARSGTDPIEPTRRELLSGSIWERRVTALQFARAGGVAGIRSLIQ